MGIFFEDFLKKNEGIENYGGFRQKRLVLRSGILWYFFVFVRIHIEVFCINCLFKQKMHNLHL